MTSTTDPDQQFRVGMLLNDTRYRGYTFQFIALITLIGLFYWLISNAIYNLAQLGQNISFSFLWQPAGYNINQQPIPFESTDTHMRAAIVGVLNTLLVSLFGCVTATILGIVVGVLRLSNNWLVSRMMAAYVEIFRNVPVLIWILIIYSVLSNVLPAPSAFRGDNPEASMLFGSVAATNRGIYVPRPIWEPGSAIVVAVFLLSLVAIFFWQRYRVKKLYEEGRVLPGWQVVAALFILPTLLAYFVLGRPVTLEYPELRGFNFQGGLQVYASFISLWLALSLYTGAFIAENVRGGIQSVSRGQTEAAASLGLRPRRIMSLVVLPQALRVMIPPNISQYLNLTKNSSLAAAIGYMDVTGTLGGVTLNQTGRSFECILLLMAFYLVISLAISGVMNIYNERVKLKER